MSDDPLVLKVKRLRPDARLPEPEENDHMTETQETVYEWMHSTFPGSDPATPRKALRALEEMAELCKAAGATQAEVIVATEKAYSGMRLKEAAPEPEKVADEAADVLIVLYGLAGLRGIDLHAEVDRKMARNRLRKWKTNGDGTGYHIKETEGVKP